MFCNLADKSLLVGLAVEALDSSVFEFTLHHSCQAQIQLVSWKKVRTTCVV